MQMAHGTSAATGPVRTRSVTPFGETTDPGAYVARPSAEAALRSLQAELAEGRSAALVAPPGLGKTTLLHELARRLGERCLCVHLPYGALSTEELCAWALGRMGSRAPSELDPDGRLVAIARSLGSEGRALVLLIDDAGSLPLETARELMRLTEDASGALRLVLAVNDDAIGSRLVACAGAGLEAVAWDEPLDRAEVDAYVAARLGRVEACAAVRRRFDAQTLAWLHRTSGGVPRRLHRLATELIEGSEPGEGWRRLTGTMPTAGQARVRAAASRRPAPPADGDPNSSEPPALDYDPQDLDAPDPLEYDPADLDVELD